jgi:hypothetical protein
MKKIYLSTFLLAICAISAAQTKVAQTHGESLPYYNQAPESKGFVIWSEDFSAGGVPSGWTNTTVAGPVDWKYTTVGHTGGFPTAALESTSAADGWMIVDSDADNFSGGGVEDSQLLTDTIDCTGYTNVKLEFQQMFRRWVADVTTVRVTTDGGSTYTDYIINTGIDQSGTPNPDYVNIDISAAIAPSPSTVQICFWWQGNWDYGWQIDDIAVKEIDTDDVLMKNEAFSSAAEFYMTPLNHAMALNFTSDVENIGLNAQTNVLMNVDVSDGSSSVFNGTSNTVLTLAPGATDSLGLAATFTPASIGTYTVTYTASQDETDLDLSNNVKMSSFEVTDTVYALDNGIYGGEWWNQDTQGLGSDPFHLGTAFEINEDDIATSISVYIGPNTVAGATIILELYEYDAAGEAFPVNTVAESDIYDVVAADIGTWITVPLQSNYQVTSGTPVMASVYHFGGPNVVYVGYSTNTAPGYTFSADDPNSAWSGQPRCPMIRLNLANGVNEVEETADHGLSVYPNPGSDKITLSIGQLDSDAIVSIIDMTGKVVYSAIMTSGAKQMEIDVQGLAAGFYELTIESDAGISSKKVSVK